MEAGLKVVEARKLLPLAAENSTMEVALKKLVTMLACAVALATFQVDEATAQTIGFKIGPTFSTMDSDPDDAAEEEQDRLTSFGGGGFVRFGFAGLSLQLEALAITKGSAFEDQDAEFGEFSAKLKMNYIEVPLTAMFSFGKGPYLFGGPTFAFETSCKAEFEFEGGEISSDCDEGGDPSEDGAFERKKFDLGVTAGAGFQFPLGPGSVLVEGRHTWGLTNLNDAPNDEQKVRHRSIAVFAGYAIPIGNR